MLTQEVRELKKQLASGHSGPPAGRAGGDSQSDSPTVASTKTLDRRETRQALERAARALNIAPLDVPRRVGTLLKEVADLKAQLAAGPKGGELSADKLIESAAIIAGVKVIVAEATGANPNVMRQLIDQVRRKASPAAVLLASAEPEKVTVVAGVSQELVAARRRRRPLGERDGGRRRRWRRRQARHGPGRRQAAGKAPRRAGSARRQVIKEMMGG